MEGTQMEPNLEHSLLYLLANKVSKGFQKLHMPK